MQRLCSVVVTRMEDMDVVERTIARELRGEDGRCSFLRSLGYQHLRLKALYDPVGAPDFMQAFAEGGLRVQWRKGLRLVEVYRDDGPPAATPAWQATGQRVDEEHEEQDQEEVHCADQLGVEMTPLVRKRQRRAQAGQGWLSSL